MGQILVADQRVDVLEAALDVQPGDQIVISEQIAEVERRPATDVGPELAAAYRERGLAYVGK